MAAKRDNIDFRLYAVTDRKVLKGIKLEEAVEQAILGGATIVQVREKEVSTLEYINIATKVKAVTDKFNIPLVVNDRVDVALAVDADGVHVGEDDMPVKIARALLGSNKIIGVSFPDIARCYQAYLDGADYLGVGAVYGTTTKPDAGEGIGLKVLADIKQQVPLPVVAIGGIGHHNAKEALETGVDGIAVISSLFSGGNIRENAERLKDLLA